MTLSTGKSTTTTDNRVKTTGEVFTPDSIVNEMLDESDKLITRHTPQTSAVTSDYIDYIDRIILEPTCGNGNFLIRILERKLQRLLSIQNELDQTLKEINLLRCLSSIHGIDITAENVVTSKLRMLELIETGKTDIFELGYKTPKPFNIGTGFGLSSNMRKSIQSILDRNIQCGNLLTNEKLLIWKSNYITDIWSIDKSKLLIGDSLIRTDTTQSNIGELEITQYNFDLETKTVQLRTKLLSDMKNHREVYTPATKSVPYSHLYELESPPVYTSDAINNLEEDIEDEFNF
jgi:hypothetical protein